MVDATRALLDELMGKERNVPLMERSNRELTFSSPEVCKYAIAGLCPYGLFRNTKSDLGACKYEAHDEPSEVEDVNKKWEEMKATWAGLSEHEKARYGYEAELLELLEQLTRDMDRKIERQKERAAKDNAPRIPSATEQAGLDALQAREKELLENSEKLAENGDIDGSLALAKQVEITRAEYEEAHRKATERDRTMTVCDVCGVFMTSTDSEARREEHLAGKQFQGWLSIRKKLDELRQKLGPGGSGAAPLPGPPPPSVGRSSRPSEPSRDRDRDRDRDYRRDRDNRDREFEHRGHTSGSRDRDRYHERERGRGGYDERARSPRRRSPVRDRDRDGYRRGDSSGYQRRERDY